MRVRIIAAAGLAAVATIAVSACGASSNAAIGARPKVVLPALGAPVKPTPSTTGTPPPTCDPTKSFRPDTTPGPTVQAIKARGQLVVGVDQNTYLFGYRNPFTGQISGFDIDILHQMAQALLGDPNKIKFVVLDSAQRIPALASGQVDMVAETMTESCTRWQQVDFSTTYLDAAQRLLVDKGSTVRQAGDLKSGDKVCAAAGSTSIAAIANPAIFPGKPVPYQVSDWTDCLVALEQGTVKAVSTDDTILAGLAAQDPNTQVVGNRLTDEPYGIAVAKGHEDLVRFVNGVLAQIESDGTWTGIYDKWLAGPLAQPAAVPHPSYLD